MSGKSERFKKVWENWEDSLVKKRVKNERLKRV